MPLAVGIADRFVRPHPTSCSRRFGQRSLVAGYVPAACRKPGPAACHWLIPERSIGRSAERTPTPPRTERAIEVSEGGRRESHTLADASAATHGSPLEHLLAQYLLVLQKPGLVLPEGRQSGLELLHPTVLTRRLLGGRGGCCLGSRIL